MNYNASYNAYNALFSVECLFIFNIFLISLRSVFHLVFFVVVVFTKVVAVHTGITFSANVMLP